MTQSIRNIAIIAHVDHGKNEDEYLEVTPESLRMKKNLILTRYSV